MAALVDKTKEVAQQELEEAKQLAQGAVGSGAYLYPIKGIFYFATHRALWKPMMQTMGPALGTALAIYPTMFFVTYVPQAAVLTIFNGPLAIFTTVLLVLSEASTLFTLVVKNAFISEALLDTFDGALISKDLTTLVSKGRDLKPGSSNQSDPIGRLGRALSKPFSSFSLTALIRYLLYLPLNFIPIIGTVLFVLLQGKKLGPAAHARYFQLKGMSIADKEKFVHNRRGAYTAFGVVAQVLEMVPVVGLFFAYTNVVGAALWAARLERGETTAPNLRETVEKAE